ncbi:MAG: phosphatase PAP2 family protein [Candidatus Marinimicrobia bacterium]|jgi:undecaprenyl-diphosphatase|nr:phosphatase PAP2 family protein [Candidatus Neomarinimicrobiota bacterium]
METLLGIDNALFYFFNSTIANTLFDRIMPVLTNIVFLFSSFAILAIILLIFGNKKIRLAIIISILAVSTSDIICARILKPAFKRIRPSRSLENVHLLVKKGGKYGFPSNHAANVSAGMFVLSFFFRKYRYAFLAFALIIGFSRIYVGVHFPLDVLAGLCLGVLFAVFWIGVWTFIRNREEKKGRTFFSPSDNTIE